MSSPSIRSSRAALALAAAALWLAACTGTGDRTPSRTGLLVSDLHFNPLARPQLADQLVAAPIEGWDAILATSPDLAYTPVGRDTNFLLLQSALAAMQAAAPDPDTILITGDSLGHVMSRFFVAPAVTDPSPAALRAFVEKTEAYLAMKLGQAFPHARIVAALGDWDQVAWANEQADADFLAANAAAWGPVAARQGAAAPGPTFATGGYYATPSPVDPRGRLLVLHTQPWAAECVGCTSDEASTGAVELAWLEAELADARAHGERAWLLGHIPPGVAAPPTGAAAPEACVASVVPFYAEPFATLLLALYREYADVIRFGLFAHQHRDDFRLVRDEAGTPLFGIKGVPAITPVGASDPAFVRFTYDPAEGAMLDATTIRLTNLAAATTTVPGVWAEEYAFDATYGQARFDADGVADAVGRIQAGGAARAAYQGYYTASNPAGAPAGGFTPFTAYGCALDRLTVADFTACACPL